MKKLSQKKVTLLYQVFAIFSLFFQSFYPMLATVVPVYAGESVASESAVLGHDLGTTVVYEESAVTVVEEIAADEAVIGEEALEAENSDQEIAVVEETEGVAAQPDENTAEIDETKADVLEEAPVEAEAVVADEKAQEAPTAGFFVATVALNETYVFQDSLGQEVQVTFTSISGSPGSLSIEEISLTEEQQQELSSVSPIAYDITSSMANGTFAYDLSVLVPDVEETQLRLVYADSPETLDEAKEIENVELLGKTVQAKSLDHFTVFVVTSEFLTSESVLDPFPSTNELNKNKQNPRRMGQDAPYVDFVSNTQSTVSLNLVNPTTRDMWFEIKKDDNPASGTSKHGPCRIGADPLHSTCNGLRYLAEDDYSYPSVSVLPGETKLHTVTGLSGKVSVRMTFGPERDWDFDWTRFNVAHPDPDGKHQLSLGGTVYRDHKMNDCYGMISCNDKAENLSEGWVMNLYQEEDDGSWSFLKTTQTNAAGKFSFSAVKDAGTYHVCEVIKEGWTQQVQNWSGTPYHINTDNLSGNVAEGPYCRTVHYEDIGSRSNVGYFGNVDTKKPFTEVLSPATNGVYTTASLPAMQIRSIDGESGIAQVVANLYGEFGLIKTCVNQTINPTVAEHTFVCDLATTAGYLGDGAYFVKTNAKDAGGTLSNTVSWHFNIDNTAPAKPTWGTIYRGHGVNPVNEIGCGGFTNTPQITLQWNANLEPDLAGYWFGTKFTQKHEWFPASSTVKTAGMPPGNNPYHYTVIAVDQAGNESEISEQCGLILDQEAPSIPTNGYPHNIFLNSNVFDYTWDPATDNLGGPVTYEYQASQNPAQVDGVLTSGLWQSWVNGDASQHPLTSPMIPSVGTSDGTIYWQVRAIDEAGNKSNWSEIWSYTLDSQAPSIPTIESPADGTFVQSVNLTKIDWSDSLDNSAVEYMYQAFSDAGYLSNVYTSSWLVDSEISTLGTPEGTYYVRVKARDAAGNESPWSNDAANPYLITVDNTAPTSTITPPQGATVEDDTIIVNNWDGTITGTASDNLSNLSGVDKVLISIQKDDGEYWNGTAWVDSSTELIFDTSSVDPTNWQYSLPSVPTEGTYTIQTHAVDKAGNQEDTAKLIIILDKTIPEVSLSISPTNPDGKRSWYQTQPTITLTSVSSDTVGIEYQWNSNSGAWQSYASPLTPAQGKQVLYYRALDAAGNYSAIGVKNVAFDQELPLAVPNFTIDRNGNEATVEWEKASDNIGIHGYEIIWELEGQEIRRSHKVGSGTREYTITDLEDGHWRVRVRAEDLAGWTATAGSKGLTIGEGEVAGVTDEDEAIADGVGGSLLNYFTGLAGEVLGATDENLVDETAGAGNGLGAAALEGTEGQVAGAETTCEAWRYYLPMILLAVLLVILILLELTLATATATKVAIGLALAGAAILAIYLVGDDWCYVSTSAMNTLANWFWVLALGSVLAVRVFGSMFSEEK